MGLVITVEAEVHPTEDIEKIKHAILSLFPDCTFTILAGKIVGESHSIDTFAQILKEERIRDTARSVFLSSLKKHSDEIIFGINKQVATVGKISFSVENVPLGNIIITIKGENLRELIDEIAPDTRELR